MGAAQEYILLWSMPEVIATDFSINQKNKAIREGNEIGGKDYK